MSYTVRDLRMDYHLETGYEALIEPIDEDINAVDPEYLSWVEEEAAKLRGEVKELLEIISKIIE
jgi:hypothetical protein